MALLWPIAEYQITDIIEQKVYTNNSEKNMDSLAFDFLIFIEFINCLEQTVAS
jgi:hypothetical protein